MPSTVLGVPWRKKKKTQSTVLWNFQPLVECLTERVGEKDLGTMGYLRSLRLINLRVRMARLRKSGSSSGSSVFSSLSFMKLIQFWIEELSEKPFVYVEIFGSKGEEASEVGIGYVHVRLCS